MFSKNMDYKTMFAVKSVTFGMPPKQVQKVNWDKNLNWCSKLYQSYGLNLPLRGAEGLHLFLLSPKIHWLALKSRLTSFAP